MIFWYQSLIGKVFDVSSLQSYTANNINQNSATCKIQSEDKKIDVMQSNYMYYHKKWKLKPIYILPLCESAPILLRLKK